MNDEKILKKNQIVYCYSSELKIPFKCEIQSRETWNEEFWICKPLILENKKNDINVYEENEFVLKCLEKDIYRIPKDVKNLIELIKEDIKILEKWVKNISYDIEPDLFPNWNE